jgi:TonB family protein
MIGKLLAFAIASTLSLTASAANAPEPASRAKLVNCGVPDYPKSWVDQDLQGKVRLAVLVGADGSVKDAKVVESSGRRAMDQASLRASATCKVVASSNAGERASGWTALQYKWVTE